jgi:hypothetical protein
MKTMIATIAMLALGATALPSNAYAIGCMSGAAVGGVAGHVAGHHALLGAAAGCAVGHHEKVMARRRAEQQQQAPAPGYAPR